MAIEASILAQHLIDQGLLSADAVVDGDVMVVDQSSRGRNYRVIRKRGKGLFVKQVRGSDPHHFQTLQREGACYRLAESGRGRAAMASLLPTFVDFDEHRAMLVIELVDKSESVWEYHQHRDGFSSEAATLLGSGLGAYHREAVQAGTPPPEVLGLMDQQPAWILTLHQTDPRTLHKQPGSAQLVSILRRFPQFPTHLAELHKSWRRECITHGDLKWENCLIVTGSDEQATPSAIKIIDWEMADWGDSCWDVGSILQSYWSAWMYAREFNEQGMPVQAPPRQGRTGDATRAVLQQFWSSYINARGAGRAESLELLKRSVGLGAARLLQTAYEASVAAGVLTPHATMQVQFSMNILRDIDAAAKNLVGDVR